MRRSSIAYIVGMSIHLTDSSLEKIFEIIGFIYQYLKLLRQVSPQEWIFKELQYIGNMEFRFAEEQPQDDYATELAGWTPFFLCYVCLFGWKRRVRTTLIRTKKLKKKK